ncbi:MAG TPA: prenyltransferase/squalene oxidase repeat-containing protein [Gemmataceae bacterium]|nr:prenyltransferase/squalene oxidase repeat-containing protein [Gemmataceae bacterium]
MLSRARLDAAFATAHGRLLAERNPAGHWTGELAVSALSTATAIGAFSLSTPSPGDAPLIAGGIRWLAQRQNDDGGWGDTDRSISNISTTMLVRAAFHLAGADSAHGPTLRRSIAYLDARCGAGVRNHAAGIRARYGKDQTFSVPILTTCALAGLVDWNEVARLPFELACFPQAWFRYLQLPVVSYALPALIALGQAIHQHRPPWNPVTRTVRHFSRGRSLRVLENIQPTSGGFLEAIPLTSFVVMSLASIGQSSHPVVVRGLDFLQTAVRPCGGWPIDTNLGTWLTTLSINALAAAGELDVLDRRAELRAWLLAQQGQVRHPYTGAEPGAWAWTDLSGGVPDADDTAGALLCLSHLDARGGPAIEAGIRWLARLQNRDHGWPTFCRGWGHLPFDRSGADLTAHALRALAAWLCRNEGTSFLQGDHPLVRRSIRPGLEYLQRTQRADGSWLPLWFGSQFAPDDDNPTYGTARVLLAYSDLGVFNCEPARRGLDWLRSAQNADGSWGGATGVAGSIEETSLALETILAVDPKSAAVGRGLAWLTDAIEAGRLDSPAPIGFYFAKLWYYERLYPIIFSVAALGRARRYSSLQTSPCESASV